MENKLVTDIISNLRGRRAYEERKAFKLGYPSLYDYFKDKLKQEAAAKVTRQKNLSLVKKKVKKAQKNCSCC